MEDDLLRAIDAAVDSGRCPIERGTFNVRHLPADADDVPVADGLDGRLGDFQRSDLRGVEIRLV